MIPSTTKEGGKVAPSKPGVVVHAQPQQLRVRGRRITFKARLVYMASSRPVRAL